MPSTSATELANLKKENANLKEENKTLKKKIELMQKQLEEKDNIIRHGKLGGFDDDHDAANDPNAIKNLMAANEKMMKQMTKMQQQLQRNDSRMGGGLHDFTDYSIDHNF